MDAKYLSLFRWRPLLPGFPLLFAQSSDFPDSRVNQKPATAGIVIRGCKILTGVVDEEIEVLAKSSGFHASAPWRFFHS
jgi:hypothetical protein